MKEIKTKEDAIKFLEEEINISVEDISKYKYKIYDEDFCDFIKDDKELIDYANEQMEAIEENE